jgi:hypothetical protein
MDQKKSLEELKDDFKAITRREIEREIALRLYALAEHAEKTSEANKERIKHKIRIVTPRKSEKSHKNPRVHDLEIAELRKELNLRLRDSTLVIIGVLAALALQICAFIALPYVTQ